MIVPMERMGFLCCLLSLILSISAPAYARPRFNGAWRGTFHGQPTRLLPDGTYPETVHRFELRLQESGGTITGDFRQIDSKVPVQVLKNAKRFDDRACFDVTLDDETDMRACVSLH